MPENRIMTRKTVRQLRLAKGWSQLKLADRVGISQSAISKIEMGLYPSMHSDTASRLERVLGVAVADIDWLGVCTEAEQGRLPGSRVDGHRTGSVTPRFCQRCFMQLAADPTANCDNCD